MGRLTVSGTRASPVPTSRLASFTGGCLLVIMCLVAWRFVMVAERLTPVPDFWPAELRYFSDSLALILVAPIVVLVAIERRSRLQALIVLLPIVGVAFSLVSFWRLGTRLGGRLAGVHSDAPRGARR